MGRGSLPAEAERQLDCPFWRFSLLFYSRTDVEKTLLEAQDGFGADVNMLLFALWRAGDGYEVPASSFSILDAELADWRNKVLVPLRAARRFIRGRGGAESDCYRKAKALELECERAQQARMFEISACLPSRVVADVSVHDLAVENMRSYAKFAGMHLPPAMESVLGASLQTLDSPR
jgi:uncharacterized protein (TIGR02444 family)